MEEQKKTNGKDGSVKEAKQPTYDELYKAYMDLAQKHQYAVQQLKEANGYIQTFSRLDYLFKVLEVQSVNKTGMVFHDDFYQMCINEVEKIMSPQDNDSTEDKKEN